MISCLKDFNNKINNLENMPNRIDIFTTFFEIFFIIPFILFIDNKVVNETIDYYNSLNDVEKDFYFSNLHYEEYIYNSLENYIKKSEINKIRQNKEIIAEIISKHLRKSYLKDIKKIIKDKLELDEDNNKKEIINMFDNKKKQKL